MKTLYGYIFIIIIMLGISTWATTGAVAGLVLIALSYLWVKFINKIFKR